MAHIVDTELVGGHRIRAILGAPGSQVVGFNQDVWVTALHYDQRNVRISLEQYRVLREANLALLKTLASEQWDHQRIRNERGAETIETIVRIFRARSESFPTDRANSPRKQEVVNRFS